MKYNEFVTGKFIDRPNRFIAHVEIDGKIETVHVKNTGRCRELLLPGAETGLEKFDNKSRKTAFDLVSVYKDGLGWVNIDSQAPNKVVKEWLESGRSQFGKIDFIKTEFTYGESRIDFYLEIGGRKILIEVKGCTLEIEKEGYFPDAPTERGVKHLRELMKAVKDGYEAYILFVIAMPDVFVVYPNRNTHPEFADTYEEALNNGVSSIFLPCTVSPGELTY